MAMASVMLPLRTPAPPFALRYGVSGQMYSLDSFSGKAALLMFLCRLTTQAPNFTSAASSRSLTGCRVDRMIHTLVPPPCASALLGGTSR